MNKVERVERKEDEAAEDIEDNICVTLKHQTKGRNDE